MEYSEPVKPLGGSGLRGQLKKKQYVWEMAKTKPRIKPETKERMQREFEDAVLEYAAYIEHARWQAEQMEEYRRRLM